MAFLPHSGSVRGAVLDGKRVELCRHMAEIKKGCPAKRRVSCGGMQVWYAAAVSFELVCRLFRSLTFEFTSFYLLLLVSHQSSNCHLCANVYFGVVLQ